MKSKSWFAPIFLCLAMMITGARVGSTQQVQPLEPEWLRQMYEEGWIKVQEGVLQRDTGGGEYESFTYGGEGQRWLVQSFQNQVIVLQGKYNESPDENLAKLITSLKSKIDQLNADTAAAEAFDGEALQNCSFSFAGHSYAEYLTNTTGVTARSDASFHNDCGYSGDTYAYAYAHAIAGTVETTNTQNDPRGGGWVDSAATATAHGSTACHSEAQATVSSSNLGINYQTPLRQNFSCPQPVSPPVPTISGPTEVWLDYYAACSNVTWSVSVTGGTPGYTYDWYIGTTYVGSGTSYTRNYCRINQIVNVRVVARDSAGRTGEDTHTTYIYYDGTCYDCGGCMVYQEDGSSPGTEESPYRPICQ